MGSSKATKSRLAIRRRRRHLLHTVPARAARRPTSDEMIRHLEHAINVTSEGSSRHSCYD
jgi:hypothetical protein